MWAAGLAAGGALVASWQVVGRGYIWLTGGVVALIGLALGLIAGGVAPWAGTALALAVLPAAGSPIAARAVTAALAAAAGLFLVAGLDDSALLPLVTGALLLGGVTAEMMLGHWFLVDPQLPRWSLSRLAYLAAAGLVCDAGYLAARGVNATADPFLGWAFAALAVMTALLIAGVIFSLKEPSYTGVMAATGLSYLAVLTAFGAAVVGRMVVT